MELVAFDVDGLKFLIAYDHAFGVAGMVEFSANAQPSARFGAGDVVDNDLMTVAAFARRSSRTRLPNTARIKILASRTMALWLMLA